MPNIRQYRYLHKGDNEWLSEPPEADMQEEWDEAWGLIKADNIGDLKIEFTEDMYTNSEYNGVPDWVDVHIRDEMILQYKMARGIIKSLEGAQAIVFTSGFDTDVEKGWGGIGYERLSISAESAYVTLCAKHSSEEVEVDVSEQFNQAIGEA